jgi:hypothetical protein
MASSSKAVTAEAMLMLSVWQALMLGLQVLLQGSGRVRT